MRCDNGYCIYRNFQNKNAQKACNHIGLQAFCDFTCMSKLLPRAKIESYFARGQVAR
jgi:hypothetical protein